MGFSYVSLWDTQKSENYREIGCISKVLKSHQYAKNVRLVKSKKNVNDHGKSGEIARTIKRKKEKMERYYFPWRQIDIISLIDLREIL